MSDFPAPALPNSGGTCFLILFCSEREVGDLVQTSVLNPFFPKMGTKAPKRQLSVSPWHLSPSLLQVPQCP